MLRRILFASALILVSATAFTSEAKAQTAEGTVEFSGTVGGACTFSNPVAGNLVLNSTDDALLGSNDSTGNYPGGTAAEIDISCTTDATLSMTAPTATGDPLTAATFTATGTSSNLGLDFDSEGSTTNDAVAAGEQDTINVNMLVDNSGGGTIPSGTYSYEVVITATP